MSYIDLMEEVVKEVSDWGQAQVDFVASVLSPDGRPFGAEAADDDTQLADYMKVVGDPGQWLLWIDEKAKTIIGKLQAGGVTPVDIDAIKPYDLATAMAMDYSARMEKKLRDKVTEVGTKGGGE